MKNGMIKTGYGKEITEKEYNTQCYISTNVLPLLKGSRWAEIILRELIFSCAEVDWNKVEQIILRERPDIKELPYIKPL